MVRRLLFACLSVAAALPAHADTVTFFRRGKSITVEGNVLAEDSLGTMLLEGRDGRHYLLRASEITNRERGANVPLFTRDELQKSLHEEFGGRFYFLSTRHYLICHSCSTEHAKQAASLFERAYSVFTNYFRRQGGFRSKEPRQPLVAVICASREEYIRHLADELGALAEQTSGVYIPRLNRMYMYDAFGGKTGKQLASVVRRNRLQGRQLALLLRERNVSTVIHESIHQIAYNVGFHDRSAPNPLWLVEGMAMFFESPNLDARGGWKGVGEVNRERLEHFREIFQSRPEDALRRLVFDDSLLRDPETAEDGYAEAWAFTYFLARAKTDAYMRYIRAVNERGPLTVDTPELRLAEFKKAFGKAPEQMELDFRRYITRVVLK